MSPRPLRLAVSAFLLAPLLLSACSGGCGEAPPSEEGGARITTSGGSSAGGSGGGGMVSFDGKAAKKKKKAVAPQARKPEKEKVSAPPTGPVFEDIAAAAYKDKVVQAAGAVLVVGHTPGCLPCQDAMPAFRAFAQSAAGRLAVYRLNVADPAALKLLPGGKASPLPILAYYEGGVALSQRQGLPFERSKALERLETPAQYQQRLQGWLGRAVELKNFNLPEPKPEAPK